MVHCPLACLSLNYSTMHDICTCISVACNNNNNNNNIGLSLIPWHSGKPLLWDVTVASTLAGSYVDTAATGAGLVADQAADRDSQIRRSQSIVCFSGFQPVSVDNLGPFSSSMLDFLRDLGRRISHISGDDREVLFLFQRISGTIQRFNSMLLHDSFSID